MRARLIRPIAAVAAAVVLSVGLGACGGDDGDSDDAGNDTPAEKGGDGTVDITIDGSAFAVAGPVKQNKAVSVANKDSFAHTVTMDDLGGFNVSVAGDETETFVVSQAPGSYAFHCTIHPSMTGTLVVEP